MTNLIPNKKRRLIKRPSGEAFPQVFRLAGEPLDTVTAHQINGGNSDLSKVHAEELDLDGLADFVGAGGGESGLGEIHHSGNPFRVGGSCPLLMILL